MKSLPTGTFVLSSNSKAGFVISKVTDSGQHTALPFKMVPIEPGIDQDGNPKPYREFSNSELQQLYSAGQVHITIPFDEPYSSGYSEVFGSTLVTTLYDLYSMSVEVHCDQLSTAKEIRAVDEAFLAQCQKMQRVLDRNEWFAQEDIPDPITLAYERKPDYVTDAPKVVQDVVDTVNKITSGLQFQFQDDQDGFIDHLEAELLTIIAELRATDYARN